MGKGPGQRLARHPLRGDGGDLDLGVPGQEAQELGSHVPARPGDGDPNHALLLYRFEYWNFDRAPGWPYFFRSFMRGSRVRKPARFNGCRSASSNSSNARAMPCLTAPACPVGPPPPTLIIASNWPRVLVSCRGWQMIMRNVSRGKYSSNRRRFTMMAPPPGLSQTRATDVFRRPVP